MTAEPITIAAGSLTNWPITLGWAFGGYATMGCGREGCHAEFARVHIGQLGPSPIHTTISAGVALIEAHESCCPTPAPVQSEVCAAYWTIHSCAEQPGHKRVGDGQGHRCKCGDQPRVGDPVRFLQPKTDPLA